MELLNFLHNIEWLNNLITGDEKWVLYVNYAHHRQWLGPHQMGIPTPKVDVHPKKVMLSVWCGLRKVIHWEFLPIRTTINAYIYCAQLDQVASKLKGK
jgi:hypothetical protein